MCSIEALRRSDELSAVVLRALRAEDAAAAAGPGDASLPDWNGLVSEKAPSSSLLGAPLEVRLRRPALLSGTGDFGDSGPNETCLVLLLRLSLSGSESSESAAGGADFRPFPRFLGGSGEAGPSLSETWCLAGNVVGALVVSTWLFLGLPGVRREGVCIGLSTAIPSRSRMSMIPLELATMLALFLRTLAAFGTTCLVNSSTRSPFRAALENEI